MRAPLLKMGGERGRRASRNSMSVGNSGTARNKPQQRQGTSISERAKILLRTKSVAKKSLGDTESTFSAKQRVGKKKVKALLSGGDFAVRGRRSSSSVSYTAVETLRKCHYLLVKRTNGQMGLIPNTANTYEVCNCESERLFCILESERRASTFGHGPSVVLLVIAPTGNEVLRMEGWSGSVTSNIRRFVVYKRDDLIGSVRKRQMYCCCPASFIITDEFGTPVLTINKAGSEQEKRGCLVRNDPTQLYYDILLPGSSTRIGQLGKVEHVLGYDNPDEVPPDLKGCFGVELSGAMSYNQKSLLLASLFLVYRLDQTAVQPSIAETAIFSEEDVASSPPGKVGRRRKSRFKFFN